MKTLVKKLWSIVIMSVICLVTMRNTSCSLVNESDKDAIAYDIIAGMSTSIKDKGLGASLRCTSKIDCKCLWHHNIVPNSLKNSTTVKKIVSKDLLSLFSYMHLQQENEVRAFKRYITTNFSIDGELNIEDLIASIKVFKKKRSVPGFMAHCVNFTFNVFCTEFNAPFRVFVEHKHTFLNSVLAILRSNLISEARGVRLKEKAVVRGDSSLQKTLDELLSANKMGAILLEVASGVMRAYYRIDHHNLHITTKTMRTLMAVKTSGLGITSSVVAGMALAAAATPVGIIVGSSASIVAAALDGKRAGDADRIDNLVACREAVLNILAGILNVGAQHLVNVRQRYTNFERIIERKELFATVKTELSTLKKNIDGLQHAQGLGVSLEASTLHAKIIKDMSTASTIAELEGYRRELVKMTTVLKRSEDTAKAMALGNEKNLKEVEKRIGQVRQEKAASEAQLRKEKAESEARIKEELRREKEESEAQLRREKEESEARIKAEAAAQRKKDKAAQKEKLKKLKEQQEGTQMQLSKAKQEHEKLLRNSVIQQAALTGKIRSTERAGMRAYADLSKRYEDQRSRTEASEARVERIEAFLQAVFDPQGGLSIGGGRGELSALPWRHGQPGLPALSSSDFSDLGSTSRAVSPSLSNGSSLDSSRQGSEIDEDSTVGEGEIEGSTGGEEGSDNGSESGHENSSSSSLSTCSSSSSSSSSSISKLPRVSLRGGSFQGTTSPVLSSSGLGSESCGTLSSSNGSSSSSSSGSSQYDGLLPYPGSSSSGSSSSSSIYDSEEGDGEYEDDDWVLAEECIRQLLVLETGAVDREGECHDCDKNECKEHRKQK